jgi:DNA-directed RNA polymerase sigma subunit (sigma70/sigma32)
MTASEVLGKCMKNIKESEVATLLQKVIKDNCNDSFKNLSDLYSRFYYKIILKYSAPLYKAGMSKKDIEVEKDFILFKAIKSFNAEQKTKFSTWFCNYSRYHVLNLINYSKKNRILEHEDIDEAANVKVYTVDKKNDTLTYLLSLLSSLKDDRVRKVYEARYFSGGRKVATWDKVAEKVGVSTQTAINLHEKTKPLLRAKVSSDNFFDFV